MKKENVENKWRYIVWVGATPDYYVNYDDAKRAYDEWIDEGYDDVHLYAADSKLIGDSRN
mgnify:FL=1